MAIYHLSAKPISRGAGRSATAAAAYRSGVEIVDERTGERHDYRRRSGVAGTFVMLPDGAPVWAADRAALWNAAEVAEKRKDARVAREVVLALPAELDAGQRREAAQDFARYLVQRHGVGVDVALHRPGEEGDHRNHHAHLLLSTRELGPEGFGAKTRQLDDRTSGPEHIAAWRGEWAKIANRCLERAGSDARIDHRSLDAQGIERVPGVHLGPKLSVWERETKQASARTAAHAEQALDQSYDAHESAAADVQLVELGDQLARARSARDEAVAQAAQAAREAAEQAEREAVAQAAAAAEQARQEAAERERAEREARQQREAQAAAREAVAQAARDAAEQAEREAAVARAAAMAKQARREAAERERAEREAQQRREAQAEAARLERLSAAELRREASAMRPVPLAEQIADDPRVFEAAGVRHGLAKRIEAFEQKNAEIRQRLHDWRDAHPALARAHDAARMPWRSGYLEANTGALAGNTASLDRMNEEQAAAGGELMRAQLAAAAQLRPEHDRREVEAARLEGLAEARERAEHEAAQQRRAQAQEAARFAAAAAKLGRMIDAATERAAGYRGPVRFMASEDVWEYVDKVMEQIPTPESRGRLMGLLAAPRSDQDRQRTETMVRVVGRAREGPRQGRGRAQEHDGPELG